MGETEPKQEEKREEMGELLAPGGEEGGGG